MEQLVEVINLWADEEGVSHFRDIKIPLNAHPMGGALSEPLKTSGLWFRQTEENQDLGWHPAPRRQLVVTLSGGVAELTASDGEARLIHPGDIVLVEDTFGQGHKSKAFDGLPRNSIFIALED
ncbi:hypothetical protein GRI89_14095 [Altererythrobacter salegens]|uniref:Cupin domain-containing protein n=1 Tax=Croceibacterium salegens TaxID=1737568 RepID=A0A6I4T211_9SPHN|nr:hypothetical protein [Croceibacterium salegens]MXO60672.1 hypothetical protein [Croceibacterium salegens]